jgi:hypothetical protein
MLTDIVRSQLNDKNNPFAFHNALTDSYDCNVAMASEAVELWSGKQLDAKTTRTLGKDLVGGSGTSLARKVFKSQGMLEFTDFQILNGVPTDSVRTLLRDGWFVVLFVKYDVMREKAPDVVGDGNYAGAHAIAVTDWWQRGVRMVHYIDPLNDGRMSASLGHKAPKGVQSVKFSHVRDAAWAYAMTYKHDPEGIVYGYATRVTA